jgi:hypothetical protein
MIRRRAVVVGIFAPIGNHSFRATGVIAYLGNGGALEHAQEMAARPRVTTYDEALRPDKGTADARRSGENKAVEDIDMRHRCQIQNHVPNNVRLLGTWLVIGRIDRFKPPFQCGRGNTPWDLVALGACSR